MIALLLDWLLPEPEPDIPATPRPPVVGSRRPSRAPLPYNPNYPYLVDDGKV